MKPGTRVSALGLFRQLIITDVWMRDDDTEMITAEFTSGVGSLSMPAVNFYSGVEA